MCQILPPHKINKHFFWNEMEQCFAEVGIPGYREWRDNTAVSESLLILCLLFNCFRADRYHMYPAAAEP